MEPKEEDGKVGEGLLPGAGGTLVPTLPPPAPHFRAAFKASAIIPSINTASEQRGAETQAGVFNPWMGLSLSPSQLVFPPLLPPPTALPPPEPLCTSSWINVWLVQTASPLQSGRDSVQAVNKNLLLSGIYSTCLCHSVLALRPTQSWAVERYASKGSWHVCLCLTFLRAADVGLMYTVVARAFVQMKAIVRFFIYPILNTNRPID